MIQAVDFANLYCVFNAAAFIATSTSHLSPGVKIFTRTDMHLET